MMLINHYYKLPQVTEGSAQNTAELFDTLIKEQFSNKEQIIAQHKSLMEYVKQPVATYFIRLYGSFTKDKYNNLRRGFLTEYLDGNRIVFCDNTFALNFTAAKAAGLPYTRQDINEFLNQKQLVFSFGITTEERELSYYDPRGAKRQNINPAGWTLAHIKPVGYGFNGDYLQTTFPNPNREEWNPLTKVRTVEDKLSENELSIARAHFLRLVHPLNSFLLPKNNLVQYEGKRLGEEADLIKFVHQYLKEQFPAEMDELESVIMHYDFPEPAPFGNIKWFGLERVLKEQEIEIDQLLQDQGIDEVYENDSSFKLLKTLRSIGMKTFRDGLYPVLKSNLDTTVQDIITAYPRYASYAEGSKKSRLSSAKTIFKNGLEEEALELIANSRI
ncbi:hypothetical protein [Empedobacter tilapiae]|uniref:Uncharacterized protein n=1 Tax=Empedobacter tilapiae TaxID=2491114 RepID=A0A4Z1BW50_9FLAO|nr:hypothetical protein [Empedobacter tilapiae]TGN29179.1 hypothetical protein E4J94_04285 [Empedobacter tilapiae]